MKFIIEILKIGADGSEALVDRSTVLSLTPLGARKEARRLLALRKGAMARVLNSQGEVLFNCDE